MCVCVWGIYVGSFIIKKKERERREKTATLNRVRKCHREKSALRRRARGRDDPFFGIQNQRAGKSRLVRCSARRVSNLNFEVLLPHTGRHRRHYPNLLAGARRTHAHRRTCTFMMARRESPRGLRRFSLVNDRAAYVRTTVRCSSIVYYVYICIISHRCPPRLQ